LEARIKFAALLAVIVGVALPTAAPGGTVGRIPQAHAVRACAGAGPYWPTMTLALQGRSAWVACKERARVVRLSLPAGRKTATVELTELQINVPIDAAKLTRPAPAPRPQ